MRRTKADTMFLAGIAGHRKSDDAPRIQPSERGPENNSNRDRYTFTLRPNFQKGVLAQPYLAMLKRILHQRERLHLRLLCAGVGGCQDTPRPRS